MKHIVIKGRTGSGKSTEAEKHYTKEAATGKHVVLIDDGDIQKSTHSFPVTEFWDGTFSPDVLVRTQVRNSNLTVTVFHAQTNEPRNYFH